MPHTMRGFGLFYTEIAFSWCPRAGSPPSSGGVLWLGPRHVNGPLGFGRPEPFRSRFSKRLQHRADERPWVALSADEGQVRWPDEPFRRRVREQLQQWIEKTVNVE